MCNLNVYNVLHVLYTNEEYYINYIIIIYFLISGNYAIARRKLKEAENISDIASGTKNENALRKSRKLRAAKRFDDYTSSDDEIPPNYESLPQYPIIEKCRNEDAHCTKRIKKNTLHGKLIL